MSLENLKSELSEERKHKSIDPDPCQLKNGCMKRFRIFWKIAKEKKEHPLKLKKKKKMMNYW